MGTKIHGKDLSGTQNQSPLLLRYRSCVALGLVIVLTLVILFCFGALKCPASMDRVASSPAIRLLRLILRLSESRPTFRKPKAIDFAFASTNKPLSASFC